MTLLECLIHRFLPRAGKAMRVMQTLMFRRVQWQSILTGLPVDAEGHPIPWITYPALDYLSQLDFSKSKVLDTVVGKARFGGRKEPNPSPRWKGVADGQRR